MLCERVASGPHVHTTYIIPFASVHPIPSQPALYRSSAHSSPPNYSTPPHSLRLPGYIIAFETIFGLPGERLSIRHDAGSSAEPYVAGTLLAVRKVMEVRGLVRGLDQLLFHT